ncbi:MAG: phenylalanine--tRNA ligase subunit beta [bacterium]|nr:phenylalanine--tRNA ligase subunit beta [bacterium]
MKISYRWLKDYVDFNWTPSELAESLTMLGLEVSGLEKKGDDTVLELEVTVNRGDCLSMIGIAREVAAATGNKLKLPAGSLPPSGNDLTSLIKIDLRESTLCRRYTARIIKGIKVEPSPAWMQEKLLSAGLRPINNIVDVTNFVLLEFGQPLHAFDYDRLAEGKIIIRRAMPGEVIMTLDEATRQLIPDMLVIADAREPVALAGIMGGIGSEVTEATSTILLESAFFDPTTVRLTSRFEGLSTESSYRFERGVDPFGVLRGSDRAVDLICRMCPEALVSDLRDKYPNPLPEVIIDLRPSRVNRILGTTLGEMEIRSVLTRLGFKVLEYKPGRMVKIKVPSFRGDIYREIDLIEEIGRSYGYNRMPTTLPAGLAAAISKSDQEYRITDLAREVLTAAGLYEVYTPSLSNLENLAKIKMSESKTLKLSNPLSEEQVELRTTLLPHHLEVISQNIKHYNLNLKIFEFSRVFIPKDDYSLPEEKRVLAGALIGEEAEADWKRKPAKTDFFSLSGILAKLLKEIGIDGWTLVRSEHPFLHPGQKAEIRLQEKSLGYLGQLHPQISREMKLPKGIYLFELDWETILPLINLERKYRPLPRYPAIHRDLAVVTPVEMEASQVLQVIQNTGGKEIEQIKLFDVYQGDQVPPGYMSLAYTIIYRNPAATLTDEEVNRIHTKIIEALREELGVSLRES